MGSLNTNVEIKDSLAINKYYGREAIIDVFIESKYYSFDKFGSKSFILAQWDAHNISYSVSKNGLRIVAELKLRHLNIPIPHTVSFPTSTILFRAEALHTFTIRTES